MNLLKIPFHSNLIGRSISQLTRNPAHVLMTFRPYSGKSTDREQGKDWMDAEDGDCVQEAIRSVSEETLNIPGETVVQTMGDRETVVEETPDIPRSVSNENIQKDWMNSDEDSNYAKEAIRAVSQETFSAPTTTNVQSVHAQPLNTTKAKSTPSFKQDWLEDEEPGLVDEAVRAVENDTINVPGETNVQKTSEDS